ncbi:hypothetical protein ACFXKF_32640 [Streptomyces scopuliridis]|uniref:hypothetical protein n=1 Tax=Streptomyces scopuliridis TaxID=452529 RepID=UPI00368E0EF3
MPDEAPRAEPEKVTIQPARPWPVYNVDRAKAELIAMELLTQGLSQYRVRIMTKLSSKNVRRLAGIVAEDAKNPQAPRMAGRTPARIRVRPAGSRSAPPAGDAPLPGPCDRARIEPEPEPEQMAFSLD